MMSRFQVLDLVGSKSTIRVRSTWYTTTYKQRWKHIFDCHLTSRTHYKHDWSKWPLLENVRRTSSRHDLCSYFELLVRLFDMLFTLISLLSAATRRSSSNVDTHDISINLAQNCDSKDTRLSEMTFAKNSHQSPMSKHTTRTWQDVSVDANRNKYLCW